jgi:uncharacterized membrane protein
MVSRHNALTADQLSYVIRQRRPPVNVTLPERWLSMLTGAALAAFAFRGFRRRSPASAAAAMASAVLFYRGATGHCHLYQAAGINRRKGTGRWADLGSDTRARLGGSAGLLVEESISIRRRPSDVYRFWRQLENLPRVLSHLESVTLRADGTSHWRVRGRAGIELWWDARIINDIPDTLIAWQSLEGAPVATAGSVHFTEAGSGTVVRVRFQYAPPAGRIGALVAGMLGDDPSTTLRDDLRRLKALLEAQAAISDPRYSPAPPSA